MTDDHFTRPECQTRSHSGTQASRAEPKVSRLHQRLLGVDLTLRPPDATGGSRCAGFLEEVRSFRDTIYAECSSLPASHDADDDPTDELAWHLTARLEGRLVGCIRLFVIEPEDQSDMPASVLRNSGCRFSAADESLCLEALHGYRRRWLKLGGPLVQAGGLAVARSARGSAVAPALCMAGNAFIRQLLADAGIVFAAEKTGGAPMYAKAGCLPLSYAGAPLPYLDDPFHQDRILVMGIDPLSVAPDVNAGIVALGVKLGFDPSRIDRLSATR